jgi:signal-transduction protein with cAMP-binding, CBS, and nucleotidyltransferase domain
MERLTRDLPMDLRESLGRPVSDCASSDFVSVASGDSVVMAAREMMKGGATEAVVANGAEKIGIVTERDILYKVVAEGLDPGTTDVGAIMSAPVETVEENAKAGDAIAKMSKLGIRRLGVTRRGRFVGLVTQKNLVSGRLRASVPLPELSEPGGVRCPYCGSSAKDSGELSRHIDRIHIRLSLLEGGINRP